MKSMKGENNSGVLIRKGKKVETSSYSEKCFPAPNFQEDRKFSSKLTNTEKRIKSRRAFFSKVSPLLELISQWKFPNQLGDDFQKNK